MGNTATSGNYEDDTEEDDLDPFDGIPTLGYRVLGVQPNSPASKAGLVSFLDFLVGAEQKMLLGSGEDLQPGEEYDDVDLPALLAEFKGKELELLVWNIKSQQARLVKLIPDDTWGGAGLLGVTIRLDNYAGAEDRLVRVLSVEPKSPAAVAGLVPEKDFLLGTTHQTLESTNQLAAVLQEYQDHVVELYVYNTDSDIVRVVALMPTLSWGGGGLLGAEVGTGYLHRLPASARETEGQSVERKVRYVRSAPSAGGGNNSTNATDGNDKHSGGNGNTLLELEPQLEMEPSDQEDEEEEAEEVKLPATKIHSDAERPASEGLASSTNSSNKPTEEPHQANLSNETSSTSNGYATTDAVQAQLPREAARQVETEQKNKVTAAAETTNNAGYVFSQPPPRVYAPPAVSASTPAATKSSLLPPPPQMHYDSPSPTT